MRLLIALAVFVAFPLAFVPLGFAAAQEETTGESTVEDGDPLTRYDDDLTRQLAADYEAAKQEQEAYLRENPTASYPIKDEVNALSNARLRAIENAPVPEDPEARAAELRKQAESLYSLQAWADGENVNIDSDVYWGGAEDVAEEYEAEAEELEAEAAEEEAAREDTEEASEATTGGAAGGGEVPDGDSEEPPSQKLDDGQGNGDLGVGNVSGGGVNLLPVAALAALGLVGMYLYARRQGGLEGLREAFSGLPKAPKPQGTAKPRHRPRGEVPEAPPQRPGPVTEVREGSRGSEGEETSPKTPQGRVTPPTEREAGNLDDETLAEWFAQEMSEEPGEETKKESQRSERRKKRRGDSGDTPEEARETPKKAPATKPDLNEIVDEQLGAMWEAGELGPMDKVEVRIEDGKIVVRKKE